MYKPPRSPGITGVTQLSCPRCAMVPSILHIDIHRVEVVHVAKKEIEDSEHEVLEEFQASQACALACSHLKSYNITLLLNY